MACVACRAMSRGEREHRVREIPVALVFFVLVETSLRWRIVVTVNTTNLCKKCAMDYELLEVNRSTDATQVTRYVCTTSTGAYLGAWKFFGCDVSGGRCKMTDDGSLSSFTIWRYSAYALTIHPNPRKRHSSAFGDQPHLLSPCRSLRCSLPLK